MGIKQREMNRKEFIAELTSDLKQYDESNLIDFRSVNLWIKSGLKRFGNNIMTPTEYVLKVEGGKAQLPDNFWKLDLAVKCDPMGYSIESGDIKKIITDFTFKTRVEQNVEWNNSIQSHIGKDYKQITEKVYINSNIVNYHYNNPILLKLTKGIKKESCTGSCMNLKTQLTHSSPWEINILNNILQSNFNKGYIYMQYSGLPTDEDGELVIPETQHDHLFNYLMYHCKSKIMENLMGNGDEPNLINMYKIYTAKEREYFSLAMTEVKFEGLSHDWDKKMKNKMRLTTMKYENLFPNK